MFAVASAPTRWRYAAVRNDPATWWGITAETEGRCPPRGPGYGHPRAAGGVVRVGARAPRALPGPASPAPVDALRRRQPRAAARASSMTGAGPCVAAWTLTEAGYFYAQVAPRGRPRRKPTQQV